jgi:hypothetical protein
MFDDLDKLEGRQQQEQESEDKWDNETSVDYSDPKSIARTGINKTLPGAIYYGVLIFSAILLFEFLYGKPYFLQAATLVLGTIFGYGSIFSATSNRYGFTPGFDIESPQVSKKIPRVISIFFLTIAFILILQTIVIHYKNYFPHELTQAGRDGSLGGFLLGLVSAILYFVAVFKCRSILAAALKSYSDGDDEDGNN